MAYTTANKITSKAPEPPDPAVQVVTADVESAEGASESRIDRVLRMAERIVGNLAPPDGEPRSEGYRRAAADAEVAVFEYLWDTKGYVGTARSAAGSSVSYQSNPAVLRIVEDAMGDYATGGGGTAAASVSNVSPEPLWSEPPC